jgi:hypothetical protein
VPVETQSVDVSPGREMHQIAGHIKASRFFWYSSVVRLVRDMRARVVDAPAQMALLSSTPWTGALHLLQHLYTDTLRYLCGRDCAAE